MLQTHLWPEETVKTDGETTVSVTIEAPDQARHQLWYRLPAHYSSLITPSCDPFVVATLLLAMRWSAPIKVHGQVSPSLLQNLEEFQAAWSAWEPDSYHPIEINADMEQEQPPADSLDKAIVAFSGGVDSCFTVFRHRTGRCGRWQRNLQAALMVHGFDIPLEARQEFTNAAEKARALLATVGVDLIPMATNFRQLPLDWEDAFGTAVGSCLMLLQSGYRTGLIASSFPYQALSLPYGSNPITDWMLSSNAFKIVHDAAAFPRLEKMREIVNWPEALSSLRVCWQGSQGDRNCGRCEKCVRTILNFRILGVGLPECFEEDITDDQIRNIRVTAGPLTEMERVLAAAQLAGISDSWVQALETCIRHNQPGAERQEFKVALKRRLPKPLIQLIRQVKKQLPH